MEDLIRRQDAIEEVKFGITHAARIDRYTGERVDLFQASNDELEKAIERIKDLPSVSVAAAEKVGEWIDGHCSLCGCDVPAYIIDWKWQKDMEAKFCPNCGARMTS